MQGIPWERLHISRELYRVRIALCSGPLLQRMLLRMSCRPQYITIRVLSRFRNLVTSCHRRCFVCPVQENRLRTFVNYLNLEAEVKEGQSQVDAVRVQPHMLDMLAFLLASRSAVLHADEIILLAHVLLPEIRRRSARRRTPACMSFHGTGARCTPRSTTFRCEMRHQSWQIERCPAG